MDSALPFRPSAFVPCPSVLTAAGSVCQISSVMNGMIGCRSRSEVSRTRASTVCASFRDADPFSSPSAGLESSRYQSQYSCQMKWYRAEAASLNRYSASAARTSVLTEVRRERIHLSASDEWEVMSSGFGEKSASRFIITNLLAFQILFAKLR